MDLSSPVECGRYVGQSEIKCSSLEWWINRGCAFVWEEKKNVVILFYVDFHSIFVFLFSPAKCIWITKRLENVPKSNAILLLFALFVYHWQRDCVWKVLTAHCWGIKSNGNKMENVRWLACHRRLGSWEKECHSSKRRHENCNTCHIHGLIRSQTAANIIICVHIVNTMKANPETSQFTHACINTMF